MMCCFCWINKNNAKLRIFLSFYILERRKDFLQFEKKKKYQFSSTQLAVRNSLPEPIEFRRWSVVEKFFLKKMSQEIKRALFEEVFETRAYNFIKRLKLMDNFHPMKKHFMLLFGLKLSGSFLYLKSIIERKKENNQYSPLCSKKAIKSVLTLRRYLLYVMIWLTRHCNDDFSKFLILFRDAVNFINDFCTDWEALDRMRDRIPIEHRHRIKVLY